MSVGLHNEILATKLLKRAQNDRYFVHAFLNKNKVLKIKL